MSTPTELFIAAELPKRPYTNTFPFAAGKTLITTGVGLEVVAGDAPGEYLDNTFRIKDNDNTTKKIAFQASGIATGETRTITMPDADVNLSKTPTGIAADYISGGLSMPLVDGTYVNLNTFGGTHLDGPNSPATVLSPNGHYLFSTDTAFYYAGTRLLTLPTAPADKTYVRLSNVSGISSFATGAGAEVTPGGSDKINGSASTLDITTYLVNYRGAVITFTYTASSANWNMSVLGDLIRPSSVAIYDADKTNSTTLTPVADLTANRVITLPDADVNLGKVSQAASTSTDGYLTSTDWNTFNGKQATLVSGTNIKTVNGSSLLGSGDLTIPVLQIRGSGAVNLLEGSNTVLSMGEAFASTFTFNLTQAGLANQNSVTYLKILGSGANSSSTVTFKLNYSGFPIGSNRNVVFRRDDYTLTPVTITGASGTNIALGSLTLGKNETLEITVTGGGSTNDSITFHMSSNSQARISDSSTRVYRQNTLFSFGWNLAALTGNVTHTYPNTNINFGDLPSIATTNSNVLSGTRNRILGGSSNAVSGTDNVVVTGSNNTLSASGQVVLTGDFIAEVTWNCAVITAAMADSATYRKTVAVTTAMMGATFWSVHLNGACTTGGEYSATTVPKSYLSTHGSTGSSATFYTIGIHTLTIIGRTENGAGSTIGSANRFVGKRRVVVSYTSGTVTVDITTEGTDYSHGSAVTMNITNDAGKLKIAPFFTNESASETNSVWNVLVESVYTTL